MLLIFSLCCYLNTFITSASAVDDSLGNVPAPSGAAAEQGPAGNIPADLLEPALTANQAPPSNSPTPSPLGDTPVPTDQLGDLGGASSDGQDGIQPNPTGEKGSNSVNVGKGAKKGKNKQELKRKAPTTWKKVQTEKPAQNASEEGSGTTDGGRPMQKQVLMEKAKASNGQ